jgi:hypothetical protein
MGEVVPLRKPKAAPKHKWRKKKGEPWRLPHLRGKRPRGHPKVKYGPKGKVLIATGQVWVALHSQELMVVTQLIAARKTFYPYDVVFARYRSKSIYSDCIGEANFRASYKVWEDYLVFNKETMTKLAHLSRFDPESPWRGHKDAEESALKFFGLDADGNRTD